MTIKLYTIKTCPSCLEYESTLSGICRMFNISLETYDIDHDPIASVQYLQEHKHCAKSIPFFVIYDHDHMRINCFSGILKTDHLIKIITSSTNNI